MYVKLPVQLTPSPEYPDLQEQEKLPGVFRQFDAPGLQLLSPLVHSFISNTTFVFIFNFVMIFFQKKFTLTISTIPRKTRFASTIIASWCILTISIG